MNIKLAACIVSISLLLAATARAESGAATVGRPIGEPVGNSNSGAVGIGRGHAEDAEEESVGEDTRMDSNTSRSRSGGNQDDSARDRRGISSGGGRNPAINPSRGW